MCTFCREEDISTYYVGILFVGRETCLNIMSAYFLWGEGDMSKYYVCILSLKEGDMSKYYVCILSVKEGDMSKYYVCILPVGEGDLSKYYLNPTTIRSRPGRPFNII